MATAIISNAASAPVSSPTLVIVAKSTDNFEKGVAAGTFPAGATQFTMVLEGFNGIYNLHRARHGLSGLWSRASRLHT